MYKKYVIYINEHGFYCSNRDVLDGTLKIENATTFTDDMTADLFAMQNIHARYIIMKVLSED